MFIKLIILFTLVPVIEIYVLISAGQQIGALPTIGLIILTGIAGAAMARSQGFALLNRIQNELSQGRLPQEELIDGAMILTGGLLLLTPGFCTDLFGFFLLTPVTRQLLKGRIRNWLQNRIRSGQIHINRF